LAERLPGEVRFIVMQNLFSRYGRIVALLTSAFALFAAAPSGDGAEPTEDQLIVPGKSVGKTHLGPNGTAYLKDLPKPNASDPGMSQNRLIWISGKAPEMNTLFIHTVSNGVIDAKPADGVTIDEIRITSKQFETREEIKCGNTLAEIRKVFPEIQPSADSAGSIYQDAAHGIAFEFAEAAKDDSFCIAITVFAPNAARITDRDQIARLLKDKP
jgi:hypothetical protein